MAEDILPMMGAQVQPGPCPPEGCPAPTEIACIQTTKVYDFCFQQESREDVCFPIPTDLTNPPVPGATITCTVDNVTCTVLSVTPSGVDGFANVTLLITVSITFSWTNPDNTTGSFTDTFSFTKTVTLCAPDGTNVTCEIAASRCGPSYLLNNQICTQIDLCILIESLALVKLLVPAYGFCTPSECVVLPKPPLACPPSPLYPPQCTT